MSDQTARRTGIRRLEERLEMIRERASRIESLEEARAVKAELHQLIQEIVAESSAA